MRVAIIPGRCFFGSPLFSVLECSATVTVVTNQKNPCMRTSKRIIKFAFQILSLPQIMRRRCILPSILLKDLVRCLPGFHHQHGLLAGVINADYKAFLFVLWATSTAHTCDTRYILRIQGLKPFKSLQQGGWLIFQELFGNASVSFILAD